MRSRDVTIPLTLWICAAICAHFLFGTGGAVVAQIHDDRSELWKLSREASELAKHGAIDVRSDSSASGESKDEAVPPTPPPPPHRTRPSPTPTCRRRLRRCSRPPSRRRRNRRRRRSSSRKSPRRRRTRRLPASRRSSSASQSGSTSSPTKKTTRNAKFIADEANRVQNETVATQTSHDRDDTNPTPAGAHRGAEQNPGDSERQRIAEAEAHKGEKNRAPGETGRTSTSSTNRSSRRLVGAPTTAAPQPQPPQRARPTTNPCALAGPAGSASPATPGRRRARFARCARTLPTAPGASTRRDLKEHPAPTPIANRGGGESAAPRRQAMVAARARPGCRARRDEHEHQPGQIASIVGQDNLRKLREADGERRKSEHRGSWAASNFDRWRSAIENYVSSVKPGNQTALNAAPVPSLPTSTGCTTASTPSSPIRSSNRSTRCPRPTR